MHVTAVQVDSWSVPGGKKKTWTVGRAYHVPVLSNDLSAEPLLCHALPKPCEPGVLEFATFNDLVLANTFGLHKASRRWTWHSPNRQHHNQIDYILVRKLFRSGMNIAKTRSFPWADIGSGHHLLMMTFHRRLKKNQQAKTGKTQVWPRKAERSQCIRNLPSHGRFTPLTIMNNEDADLDSMITTFNTAVTDTASEVLSKLMWYEQGGGGGMYECIHACIDTDIYTCIYSSFLVCFLIVLW